MSVSKSQVADDPLAEKVIDELYEVAVDPTRYENLLDHWEQLIAPHRGAANAGRVPVIPLPEFESHFQRADRVLRDVTVPLSEMPAEQVIARIDRTAALAIDAAGRISQINPVAASLFGLGPGAALTSLPLADGEADFLLEAVHRTLRSNSAESPVLRLRGAERDRTMLFSLSRLNPHGADPFVLAVTSELGWPAGFERLLSEAFELTRAESQIVRGLSEGVSVAEIAERRSRSVETIRGQVKSILAKTGTRSQAELVRLTLSTMEMARYSDRHFDELDENSTGFDTLEERPFQTMHHADGRRQDYLILGDEDGLPCLYLPLDYGLVR